MKQLLKVFIGIAILGILIVSCKKDKDSNPNYMSVDDEKYKIAEAIIEFYGTDPLFESYHVDLSLNTSGIEVDDEDNWSGEGKSFYFEFVSPSSTGIASGTYDLDLYSSPFPEGTFYADYCLDWVEGEAHTWVWYVSGQVEVERDGDSYEITVTGEDIDGNDIEGYYKGTPEFFDWSKKSTNDGGKKRLQ